MDQTSESASRTSIKEGRRGAKAVIDGVVWSKESEGQQDRDVGVKCEMNTALGVGG